VGGEASVDDDVWPVRYEAALPAKNTAAPAICSGLPQRPSEVRPASHRPRVEPPTFSFSEFGLAVRERATAVYLPAQRPTTHAGRRSCT
jgi:hypothetical protein